MDITALRKLKDLGPVTVQAKCGCLGDHRPEASNYTTAAGFVSIRVTVPCAKGHQRFNSYREHVSAGCTERYPVESVKLVKVG